jgi:hypothetical protein
LEQEMNYIHRLEADLKAANDKAAAMKEEIQDFKKHLLSTKFQNSDTERNDWIATADVLRRLEQILSAE